MDLEFAFDRLKTWTYADFKDIENWYLKIYIQEFKFEFGFGNINVQ